MLSYANEDDEHAHTTNVFTSAGGIGSDWEQTESEVAAEEHGREEGERWKMAEKAGAELMEDAVVELSATTVERAG